MTSTATGSYPHKEFGSIEELTDLIGDGTKGWDTKWFRGAKTPNYTLLPKLFRDKKLQKREAYIAVEFRRRACSTLNNINTPFDWLCAMQHYGFPTRLLDWSESLSVALYFTVRPLSYDVERPTIWVLNPFELSALAERGCSVIPISSSHVIAANADIAFDDELSDDVAKRRTELPMPVAPDFLFTRLAMQNGAFTIHGTNSQPLEALVPDDKRSLLLKFVAKEPQISKIFGCLDLLIPSSDAMFPDIEGMKDYIV
jgi:hypothetical protein